MQTAQYNLRVQKYITALSVVLFIAKMVAYYLTSSLAILSDALESIVNVLAGVIGLYSLYIAAKPSDENHPYGHGKAEFVSAAAEGGLIVAAGVLIIYETIANFISNKPISSLDFGIVLVGATAAINYVAGFICIKVGNKNKSLALQASGKHLQTDTYSTLGIIAGLIIMSITKVAWLDKIIALTMSIFIMRSGYLIIRQSLAGIMDQQDMDLLKQMVRVLNDHKKVNWIDLHNLRVIKYGSKLHIDCHLTVPWYLNVHEAHAEIDDLTSLIRTDFEDSVEFFVHTDGCLPFSCRLCNKFTCPVRQFAFDHNIEWTLDNLLSDKKHRLKQDRL